MRGNEGNLKKNYGKLKRKLVVWMLLVLLLSIVACAVVMYVFVDGIFQAPFADGFAGQYFK